MKARLEHFNEVKKMTRKAQVQTGGEKLRESEQIPLYSHIKKEIEKKGGSHDKEIQCESPARNI
jgi:hypothetical protein